MMKRIFQRIKDKFKRNPLAKLEKVLSAFGQDEVLQHIDNKWMGIPYLIEEKNLFSEDFLARCKLPIKQKVEWWTYLSGIILPRYNNSGVNLNISHNLVYPLLRSLDIRADWPEPCFFDRRLVKGKQIPCLPVDNLSDGNVKARKIIEGYLMYKEGIEKALDYIDENYPDAFGEEGKSTRKKFREEFGLDFVKI